LLQTEVPVPPQKDAYHAYLLRLWRVQENEGTHWRASLEEVQSGELRGFEELDELQDFLETLTIPDRIEEEALEQQPDGGF
jgi:hypothetical protein